MVSHIFLTSPTEGVFSTALSLLTRSIWSDSSLAFSSPRTSVAVPASGVGALGVSPSGFFGSPARRRWLYLTTSCFFESSTRPNRNRVVGERGRRFDQLLHMFSRRIREAPTFQFGLKKKKRGVSPFEPRACSHMHLSISCSLDTWHVFRWFWWRRRHCARYGLLPASLARLVPATNQLLLFPSQRRPPAQRSSGGFLLSLGRRQPVALTKELLPAGRVLDASVSVSSRERQRSFN